jgi:hypothetical protein
VYRPLVESESAREQETRTNLELLLLAAARAEAVSDDPDTARETRLAWSNAIAAFLDA